MGYSKKKIETHYVWTGGQRGLGKLQVTRGECWEPGDVLPEGFVENNLHLLGPEGIVEKPGKAEPSPVKAPLHTYVPPEDAQPVELPAGLEEALAKAVAAEVAKLAAHNAAVGPGVVEDREAEAGK